MAVMADRSQVRWVVGAAVLHLDDVVDVVGRPLAADLAEPAIAPEDLGAELPPAARRAAARGDALVCRARLEVRAAGLGTDPRR